MYFLCIAVIGSNALKQQNREMVLNHSLTGSTGAFASGGFWT